MPADWYREAFGRHYLSVYSHRDDASAAGEADFAADAVELRRGERVLDLACGAGRHARRLAARGGAVVGMDLSADLLREAGLRGSGPLYARGDMRALPFERIFDVMFVFFTSFGYFEESREDRRVLAEARSVLRKNGRLFLDCANRSAVIGGLVPESEERRGEYEVRSRRRLTPDGKRVEKTVTLSRDGRTEREYTESVRLYEPAEISAMLAGAGFLERERFGDLAGGRYGPDAPRLVVVATC